MTKLLKNSKMADLTSTVQVLALHIYAPKIYWLVVHNETLFHNARGEFAVRSRWNRGEIAVLIVVKSWWNRGDRIFHRDITAMSPRLTPRSHRDFTAISPRFFMKKCLKFTLSWNRNFFFDIWNLAPETRFFLNLRLRTPPIYHISTIRLDYLCFF